MPNCRPWDRSICAICAERALAKLDPGQTRMAEVVNSLHNRDAFGFRHADDRR